MWVRNKDLTLQVGSAELVHQKDSSELVSYNAESLISKTKDKNSHTVTLFVHREQKETHFTNNLYKNTDSTFQQKTYISFKKDISTNMS